MKYKPILLFVVLVAIIALSNLVSCHKYEKESDDYSEWREVTEIDSVIYAKARTAYLEDPANAGSANFKIMQFLSCNPFAVRTKAVDNGKNYHFACTEEYSVTVYKGIGDEVGKVIEIEVGYDQGTPPPPPIPPLPPPVKHDTVLY